ncbi:histone deacetylase family protein [Bradyrhizobium sp.]
MTTIVFSHPVCLLHNPGLDHPESGARLSAVLDSLREPEFRDLLWREAPRPDTSILEQVHSPQYIAKVFDRVASSPQWNLDEDTVVSSHSGEAALRAAGSVCAAIDAIMEGYALNAFCAIRPPGHHAMRHSSGGFCIFNNVAIGAAWARKRHHIRRIAVVDFDVHHGNGTQSIFWGDPETLFISIHQAPFDPWSGATDEVGLHNNILNVPVSANTAGALFRSTLDAHVTKRLSAFAPELILVSAGFDAHKEDPLGGLALEVIDYEWLGGYLTSQAAKLCKGRVVGVLEGGYNPSALGKSAAAFVRALCRAGDKIRPRC